MYHTVFACCFRAAARAGHPTRDRGQDFPAHPRLASHAASECGPICRRPRPRSVAGRQRVQVAAHLGPHRAGHRAGMEILQPADRSGSSKQNRSTRRSRWSSTSGFRKISRSRRRAPVRRVAPRLQGAVVLAGAHGAISGAGAPIMRMVRVSRFRTPVRAPGSRGLDREGTWSH